MRSSTGMAGFLIGCFILCFSYARTQGLYPISTEQKINRSSLIIEGKVIEQKSAWNAAHTMIFTSSSIEIYKLFKGTITKNIIEVVTVGGAVDGFCIQASHLLHLEKNDIGIFFCMPEQSGVPTIKTSAQAFEVYSSSQGFLKYDLTSKSAAAPFVQYDDIESTLYSELSRKTGRNLEIRNRKFSIQNEAGKFRADNGTLAPVISGFTPSTVNAGALLDPTNNVLTINGSGFGNSPSGSAAVLFSDADAASGTQFTPIEFNHEFILSWTDNQIRVRVPTQAGTGPIRVRDAAGTVVNSANTLNVRFSILTADFLGEYGIKQFTLGNMNGSGGYSIKYSTNTANSGININASTAKTTFQRALNTWRDGIGVNFVEAGTTTLQVIDPDDNDNIVLYDNGGTGLPKLSDGVLSTCYSGITICTNDPVLNQARKTGFDIVIRNPGYSSGNVPFTSGPCPPYSLDGVNVDLETVLLHELGHAINLGHVVEPLQGTGAGTTNPAKVLHYSIAYNLRRISLDYTSMVGGTYMVTPHGHEYGNCVIGSPEMIPLPTVLEPKDECPSTFPVAATSFKTSISFDLVHATSNKGTDPAYNQLKLDATGTDVTNTAFYTIRTGDTSGDLILEVFNYITSDPAIASCAPGSTGVPVTGIQLAIYKVNSCPAAGSFPLPVANRTFTGNGALSPISGLTANSNYLLVATGIQNTKATFDIEFTGSALPSVLANLTGSVEENHNQLAWSADTSFGVNEMILERSADGLNFETLQEIVDKAQQESGEYSDADPLPGSNFYRLKIEKGNGAIQYSQTVTLNRLQQGFAIRLFPNPAGPNLNIEITTNDFGQYAVAMYNVFGQKVLMREFNVNSRRFVQSLSIMKLMKGVYYVAAFGKDGKRIVTSTIRIK